ncbi:hypothetical protein CHS0354_035281 [Potamilus streckersoni]|uniref:HNH nuclease domain-containing protein n=1 Tax=Potamilus streckersoni TaxID=2493646 RepID=A0AAE0S3D1_9BIVA|nr:hypothetical protein CHS0354_035281 [Potamilus streckersoni]
MNSRSVDLIYLDPPFNSKRMYSAPIGSKSAGASFKDMWTWQDVNESYLDKLVERYPALVSFIQSVQDIHSRAMMAYITYMTQRIIEMHRVLKDTGSLYLHCDPTASHYLKIVLDIIFGKKNFINEIIWSYKTGGASKKSFSKKHDIILFYSKDSTSYYFTNLTEKSYTKSETRKPGIINYGTGNAEFFEDEKGIYNVVNMKDVWEIPYINSQARERTGYPTQKPLALLNRIVESSSQPGDTVFDPFCGCATTCVAAQQLGRRWIGIDIERKAAQVLIERLSTDAGLFSDFIHRTDAPQRTDIKPEPITPGVKERLFKTQDGRCNACGLEFNLPNFEVDHIIPKAKGGGDYYENYQLLCGNCNRIKGDRPMEYLRMKIKSREEMMKHRLTFGE